MTVSSHQTTIDAVQQDGRRYVTYDYLFVQGNVERRGPKLVSSDFDDDADRSNQVPQIEQDVKLEELYRAEADAINGADFNDVAQSLLHNTVAEAAEFILKRMSNRFQVINKRTVEQELPELFLLQRIWVNLTDQQIANFMGESVADVELWRASYTDMRNGITDYGSPFPPYDDVPPL